MKHFIDHNKKRLAEIASGSWVTIKMDDRVLGAEIEDAYSTRDPIELANLAQDTVSASIVFMANGGKTEVTARGPLRHRRMDGLRCQMSVPRGPMLSEFPTERTSKPGTEFDSRCAGCPPST